MSNESTDTKLVKRVQRGDKSAFDVLVLKYQHKIVNLVMRYVRDPEQALDITPGLLLKRPLSRPTGHCRDSVATAPFTPGSTGSP